LIVNEQLHVTNVLLEIFNHIICERQILWESFDSFRDAFKRISRLFSRQIALCSLLALTAKHTFIDITNHGIFRNCLKPKKNMLPIWPLLLMDIWRRF